VQASVHEHRAASAGVSREMRTRELRLARDLYASGMARIAPVAAAVTLDYTDRIPLDNAQAGLARAEEALRQLAK